MSEERGATAIEYALGIGLVVIAMLAGWSLVEDESTDQLAGRGASIGYPAEPPGDTGGSTGGTTAGGTSDGTDDATPSYTGSVEGSCTGGADDEHTCAFSLNPVPTTPVTWSIDPSSPSSVDAGASPTFIFKKAGTFSVRALVDTTTVQRAVTCEQLGSGSTKTLKCTVGAGT